MKTILVWSVAVLLPLLGAAQTGPSEQERQELARQINQLLRDPAKPSQEVRLELQGCHVEHIIRDKEANVKTDQPLAVSISKGNSDWAVKASDGKFEMRMGFDWDGVTSISYEPARDDNGRRYFELRVQRRTKSSTTTSELDLHTTDEAQVKSLVQRLDKLRRSCRPQ